MHTCSLQLFFELLPPNKVPHITLDYISLALRFTFRDAYPPINEEEAIREAYTTVTNFLAHGFAKGYVHLTRQTWVMPRTRDVHAVIPSLESVRRRVTSEAQDASSNVVNGVPPSSSQHFTAGSPLPNPNSKSLNAFGSPFSAISSIPPQIQVSNIEPNLNMVSTWANSATFTHPQGVQQASFLFQPHSTATPVKSEANAQFNTASWPADATMAE
jgi:hypothetical protein